MPALQSGAIYYFDIVQDYPAIGGVVEFSRTLFDELKRRYGDRLKSVRELAPELGFADASMPYLHRERLVAERLACVDPRSTFFFPNFQSPVPGHARGGGPRVVNVVHDVQFAYLPELFSAERLGTLHRTFAETRDNADEIVFISEAARRQFLQVFGAPRRHRVIYNPIDAAIPAATSRMTAGAPFLLASIHYHPHKNFAGLLAFFARLAEQDAALELVITGHGGEKIRPFLADIPEAIRPRVRHLGYVDRRRLGELYRDARAFISLSRFEGFNMSAAEAASHGTPLILSDLPVHRELFSEQACFLDPTTPSLEAARAFLAARSSVATPGWKLADACRPEAVGAAYAEVLDRNIWLGVLLQAAPTPRRAATRFAGVRRLTGGDEGTRRRSAAGLLCETMLAGTMTGMLMWGVPAAHADGGAGGGRTARIGTPPNWNYVFLSGPAGGTGYNGENGVSPPADAGSTYFGGGGGGAGGGNGGTGGYSGCYTSNSCPGYLPATGGAGGSVLNPNGGDGAHAMAIQGGGGGGGGGGSHGNGFSGVLTGTDLAGGNGGNGGAGPSGVNVLGAGGGGGAGGYGAVIVGNTALNNSSAITGGAGGDGGNSNRSGFGGGAGGAGGIGVYLSDPDVVLTNTGMIVGGDGGAGGTAPALGGNWAGFDPNGAAGAGGAGIVGGGLTVINGGTIRGGWSGDGTTQADAITFTGGANTLTFTGPVSGLDGGIGLENGAWVTFEQPTDTTVASAIHGDGAIRKAGLGTLVLSGANTYEGGTSFDEGVLQVSEDANLGAAAGGLNFFGGTLATTASFGTARTVTLGGLGTFALASGTTLTLAGPISGTGALIKEGFGTLVLSGSNAYSGGTSLLDGIVEVSADANLGAASGGLFFSGGMLATTASFASSRDVYVATAGGIDVAAGTTLDLDDAISGPGILAKLGGGVLALSGASSVDWSLQVGSLTADATGFSGDVAIDAGTVFTLDAAVDAAYAGTLSGTGAFIKAGAAELDYTGDGSVYTGTTTVDGGTLAVNGTLGGPVDVLSGGTLGGNGIMGSVSIGSGGIVAPGNSIGTLHVNGDVTFAAGSFYQVELAGNGSSDLIAATGQAILDGGTVELTAIDPQTSYQDGQTYTILTAQAGIRGGFEDVVTDSIFLDVKTENEGGNVDVIISIKGDGPNPPNPPDPPAVFTTAAVTPNQFATAAALDTLPQAGPELGLYNALLSLPSGSEARAAFDQLSGEAYASAKGLFVEQSGLIRTAMIDRLRASFGAVGASGAPVVSYEGAAPGMLAYAPPSGASPVQVAADMSLPVKAVSVPATTERFALWATGFGSWADMDGNGNAAGLSSDTGGFLIGADTPVGEGWRLGVTGGYSYSSFDVSGRNASGDSDNWHVGAYAGNQWGPLGLRTGLAYTWQDVETSRNVAFPGFADQLSGDYDAGTFQAFGELGYAFDAAFAAFEPFVNLAYVRLDTDGFGERGGAAALTVAGSDMDTTFTTLGLRASVPFQLGGAAAKLRGMAGWRHAFGDIVPLTTQAFFGSDSFTVAGVPIAEDAAVLEAGLDVLVGASTTLGVAYTGQFGDGVTQNGFNATLKVSF